MESFSGEALAPRCHRVTAQLSSIVFPEVSAVIRAEKLVGAEEIHGTRLAGNFVITFWG